MSKKEKLFSKLFAEPPPKDFTWNELVTLTSQFGFENKCQGGSHYMFEHTSGLRFNTSKTHPSGILKAYQVRDAKLALECIEGECHE
jgi:predicted RNA binding protein YcfA (HicA-like mRNA interferase family)